MLTKVFSVVHRVVFSHTMSDVTNYRQHEPFDGESFDDGPFDSEPTGDRSAGAESGELENEHRRKFRHNHVA